MNGDGLTDAWLAAGTASSDLAPARRRKLRRAPRATIACPTRARSAMVARVADMNGNGTADVVWNDTRGGAGPAWRYLDLTGGVRPHLLTRSTTDWVARSRSAYSSSGAMFRHGGGGRHALEDPAAHRHAGRRHRDDERRPRVVEAGGVRLRGRLLRRGDPAVPRVRGHAPDRARQRRGGDVGPGPFVRRRRHGGGAQGGRGRPRGADGRGRRAAPRDKPLRRPYLRDGDRRTPGGRSPATRPSRRAREGTTTPATTLEEWTYDEYGDVLVHADWGVVEGANREAARDERITTTDVRPRSRALAPGTPVSGRRHRRGRARGSRRLAPSYDGPPFVGLPLGTLGPRGLPTRKESGSKASASSTTTRVEYDERRADDGDPRSARVPSRDRLRRRDPPLSRCRTQPARRRHRAHLHRRLRPRHRNPRLVQRPRRPTNDVRLHAAPSAPFDRRAGRHGVEADGHLRVRLRQPDLGDRHRAAAFRSAATPCSRSTTTTTASAETSASSSRPRTARR